MEKATSISDILLFVSHVSADRVAALDLVSELERRNIRCWIAPRDIEPGTRFDDEIEAAIQRCRAMLLVFSDRCNESDYIRREVTVAGESHKVIIPFRIENAQPKRGLRVRLADLHWIDAFIERERAIDDLVGAVRRLSHPVSQNSIPPQTNPALNEKDARPERPARRPPEAGRLSELRNAAEGASSLEERIRAIRLLGLLGGRSEIPWLKDLIFRSTRRQATFKEAAREIAMLGGAEAISSLKDIAEHHKDDQAKGAAVEQIPQLDKLSDPQWYQLFLKGQNFYPTHCLLGAVAKEGWSGRLDTSAARIGEFIRELRPLAETHEHPDIRHAVVSIVAHLCKREPWTKEWVIQRAKDAQDEYYRTRGYAIGLSVWPGDDTFVQALIDCPEDPTGTDGKMFVNWAKQGDWKRYRFHMGGWGPTL